MLWGYSSARESACFARRRSASSIPHSSTMLCSDLNNTYFRVYLQRFTAKYLLFKNLDQAEN